jgi:hypothetical protein
MPPWTSCSSQRSEYAGVAPGFFGGGRRPWWLCEQHGDRSSDMLRGRRRAGGHAARSGRERARSGPGGPEQVACGRGCWSMARRQSGGSRPWCLRPAVLGGFPVRAVVDSEPLARGGAAMSLVGRSGISLDLSSLPASLVVLVGRRQHLRPGSAASVRGARVPMLERKSGQRPRIEGLVVGGRATPLVSFPLVQAPSGLAAEIAL